MPGCDVEGVAGERRFQLEALELGARASSASSSRRRMPFSSIPRLVADAAERLGDVGLAAEVANARVFELGRRRRGSYSGKRCCFMCLPIRLVRDMAARLSKGHSSGSRDGTRLPRCGRRALESDAPGVHRGP